MLEKQIYPRAARLVFRTLSIVKKSTKVSCIRRHTWSCFRTIFFADICLFYVIPLLLSLVLYTLIAKVMLSKDKNRYNGCRQISARNKKQQKKIIMTLL